MTEKDLFREIGNINEKYITEAEETKRTVIWTPAFRRTLATAACLVVCFGLYFGVRHLDLAPQNESASMQADSNGSATKTESMIMDTASNSTADAGEESFLEMDEAGSLWEEIWPMESETMEKEDTEGSPEQSVNQESVIADVTTGVGTAEGTTNKEQGIDEFQNAESVKGTTQEGVLIFEADLYYGGCVWSGQKDVEAFLEKTANGEKAVLELIRVFEDGTHAYASLCYTGEDFYEWTPWHAPNYGQEDLEAPVKKMYQYLKVFEDASEDAVLYYVLGLGETGDFTLQDLQSGVDGTVVVLKYEIE